MSLLLRVAVATASHDVIPSWPLDSFIAVNPLGGSESVAFEAARSLGPLTKSRASFAADRASGRITLDDLEAAILQRVPELATTVELSSGAVTAAHLVALDLDLELATARPEGTGPGSALTALDEHVSRWLAAYLDPEPLWAMPGRGEGFYSAWRTLVRHDASLSRAARRALRALPSRSDDALEWALRELGVSTDGTPRALALELEHLPGWAGVVKWRAEKVGDIDLTSYLAVRFATRVALGLGAPVEHEVEPEVDTAADVWRRAERLAAHLESSETQAIASVLAAHPANEHALTWQLAFELHYRARTLASLSSAGLDEARPDLQVVMCIDPRSEGVRRRLESYERVETFGFAGFFGVPIRFARYGAKGAINSLPALLSPRHSVTERPLESAEAAEHVAKGRRAVAIDRGLHAGEGGVATPFAYAETAGWLSGLASLARTFTPSLAARFARDGELESTVTVADAFTLEERAVLAETAIRMMGMSRVGRLVVLAGHGSTSLNNLYQSALDCGACGGNPGAANARAAAAIFNDPSVREILAARGLPIPNDAFFVAAEHNTVADTVTLLDTHLVPQSHRDLVARFERQQAEVADGLVRERAVDLPGASPAQSLGRLRQRAHDWAEVYPELGLAGNAAMIIGPRELTRGVDLSRRVFLHSYRPELDPEGTGLETILTAPVVVAQWINHQYYFSSIDPERFGAGTKTIHNAIGTIGVFSGGGGDIRRGLPWQSVGVGDELLHEPQRLAVIAQAPLETIGAIISRNQVLRDLFEHEWITMTARESTASEWMQYTRYGWQPAILPAAEGAAR